MPFPSTLSTFDRPATTDRLNNPSHSALHNTVSSAIGQIEQVIGLSTTSVVGSLFYDIRSPDSNGGGHVQSAVKGGTGQTTFTKGDTFVATGASTISKLAVGLDGQAFVADSSVAAGVKWGTASGTKLAVIASTISLRSASTAETSLVSVTVPGSTLGTSNAIRSRSYVEFVTFHTTSTMATMNYGGQPVASVWVSATITRDSVVGILEGVIMGNGTTSAQRAILSFQMQNSQAQTSALTAITYASKTS